MVDEKFLSFLSVLPSVAPAQEEEDADKEASTKKKNLGKDGRLMRSKRKNYDNNETCNTTQKKRKTERESEMKIYIFFFLPSNNMM